MNAVRTELQKQQRVQRAKLAKLQQEIADGRPPALPDGKQEIFEWHPTIPDFAARIYRSGRGVWRLGYRTKAGEKRTETLGNMAVLPLSFAEKKARTVLQEVMDGRDPHAERRKLRLRPQRTVGQLCEEYFDEMMGRPEMSVRTIKGYRSVAKWYLDILRNMHFAELTAQDVATRVREISKQRSGDELDDHQHGELGAGRGGPWAAQQFRAMLSSVYKWALGVYPDEVKVNPVTGTWNPPRMKSTGQSFTMEELGVIWRACEALDATAVPMCRNGQAFKPGQHIGAPDDQIMSCTEAGRLTGFDPGVFIKAVKDRRLRGERGRFVTKTRGAHPAYVVTVGDINRFLDSRPQRSQRGDYSKVIRLLMLLGARFGEIARLRWSDLECDCADCRKRRRKFPFRFLHIPTLLPKGTPLPEGMDLRRIKSREGKPKDLVLYLPQPALDIIDSVPRHGDLLFGSTAFGAPSNGKVKAALNKKIIECNGGPPLRPDENGKPKWKHHWLRHSFETHLKEDDDIECPPWIVAAMVNHSTKNLSAIEGIYTHADYLQQQKRYLDIWANHILNAAYPDRVPIADNVSNFPGRPAAESA